MFYTLMMLCWPCVQRQATLSPAVHADSDPFTAGPRSVDCKLPRHCQKYYAVLRTISKVKGFSCIPHLPCPKDRSSLLLATLCIFRVSEASPFRGMT